MFDQVQEPIFFHEAHRAFLDNRDADVLNWEVMRLNLFWLKAGGMSRNYWTWLPFNIFLFVGSIVMGGTSILFLIWVGVEAIDSLVNDGLPYWGVLLFNLLRGGCLVVLMGSGFVGSLVMFGISLNEMSWPDRRIKALLHRVVEDGQLIKGQIISTELNRLNWQATYRFTNPAGEELERTFYPDVLMKCPEGTPVWVLYLDDKINVLL